ncbi:MAG: hypothetical protein WA961_06740 [Rhodanobacter sp.]
MNDHHYQLFLRELVGIFINKTKDESIYEKGNIHAAGYRIALYSVLHTIENEAIAWDLSSSDIGLNDFNSDAWLLEGPDYWKKQGLP